MNSAIQLVADVLPLVDSNIIGGGFKGMEIIGTAKPFLLTVVYTSIRIMS